MNRNNWVSKFFTLLGVDFYKLFRAVSFYVVFGVYALFMLLNVLLTFAAKWLTSELLEMENTLSANLLFGNSMSYGNLGLFLVIFFAVFLCSEFRTNTIRNKLTLGYSRTCVYFSSLTFTYIVSAMAVVLGCLITAVAGIPMLGWSHTDYALKYALYALFALLPLVAFIHTLAYGSKSLGIALGVGLPVILVLPSILNVLNIFVSESKAVEWVIRILFISLEEYVPLTIQGVGEELPYLALNASLSYTLWTVLFIVCGYFSFIKSDIK